MVTASKAAHRRNHHNVSFKQPPFIFSEPQRIIPWAPESVLLFRPPSPYPHFKADEPPSSTSIVVEKKRRLCYYMIIQLSLDVFKWGLRTFSDLQPGHAMFGHLQPLDGCSSLPHTGCKRRHASKSGFRLSKVHLARFLLRRRPAFSIVEQRPPPCRGQPSAQL